MTLKLESDLDILCTCNENEVARLRHLKLLILDEIFMVNEKNTKIALQLKGKVKFHQVRTTSSVHLTQRQTPSTIATRSMRAGNHDYMLTEYLCNFLLIMPKL